MKIWWLRSPDTNYDNYAWQVDPSGDVVSLDYSVGSDSYGRKIAGQA